MLKNNRNLAIITLIAVVNTLGYGIVFPILYSYSLKYGLSVFENGLLFSLFSLCQFISAPIIGRFSDKYGRRPLLIISLLGTIGSFVMMAFAPSAIFLFLARALDGLTAGNFPVAMAVISDSTKPEDRAKGFGIIGAAFGLGFALGPAISAFTYGINTLIPFMIAAGITAVAVLLTYFFLPETNKNIGHVQEGKMFDFPKLARAIRDQNVGSTLQISLIYSLAFGLLIFAYQPFLKQVLRVSDQLGALSFTVFGIVGFFASSFLIPKISKRIVDKKFLLNAVIISAVAFFAFFVVRSFAFFVITSVFLSLSNSFINPLLSSLLSKETDEKSQGEIMGINTSYQSLGLIFGPIIGGVLATLSTPMPFLAASVLCIVCTWLSYQIFKKPEKTVSL